MRLKIEAAQLNIQDARKCDYRRFYSRTFNCCLSGPNVEATVEARLAQVRATEATVEARVKEEADLLLYQNGIYLGTKR